MKSRTVRKSLPSESLSPLPSCCMNTVGDSVGLRNITMSREGTSTPSLNMSTEKTTDILPSSRALFASSRSVPPLEETAALSIPFFTKNDAMNSAWSMDEQNPMQRLEPYFR